MNIADNNEDDYSFYITYQGIETKVTTEETIKLDLIYTVHTDPPVRVKIADEEDYWIEENGGPTDRAEELGALIEEATS